MNNELTDLIISYVIQAVFEPNHELFFQCACPVPLQGHLSTSLAEVPVVT